MQKVVVGIQTLAKFRENDYVYVDKTAWAYELMTAPAYYFLSRPRRFGKSLFLNTLLEIFSGNKSLFENTFIYDKIKWDVFPVVHLSFEILMAEQGDFSISFIRRLEDYANSNAISIRTSDVKIATYDLIDGLYQKYNKRVVILIDEYDKPLLDFLGTPTEEENRITMRYFFESLKGLDAKIHFVFITGITKFSQVSLFSTTNNLLDITFSKKYDGICGYTKQELEDNFKPQFEDIAQSLDLSYDEMMEETKNWYNGYTWGGKKVYNPFSIACLLENKAFKNYWFTSGAPRFLVDLLFNNFNYTVKTTNVFEDLLSLGFSEKYIDATALMFQTGYLTIKSHDSRRRRYDLEYPNLEVAESFQRHLLKSFCYNKGAEQAIALNMHDALCDNDINEFVNQTNQLFAQIPEPIFLAKYEAFYHAIIYLSLSLVGIAARSEEQTNIGRIDMVVPTPDRIFVIEYKVLGSAADAIAQIYEKKYYEKHLHQGKPITLLGIALGKEQRGIVDWIAEDLGSQDFSLGSK